MRRTATWISQPRGLSGTPSSGHWTAAASSASWTASSAAEKSPKRRITAPRTCGARSRRRRRTGGDLVGLFLALTVDDPETGEKLLGLRERAIRHLGGAGLPGPHHPGLSRPGQALGAHQLARLGELLVETVH